MKNQTFTGVGCFARLDRLERIFSRLVESYALGPFNGIQRLDSQLSQDCDGARLLQTLMADLTDTGQSGGGKTIRLKTPPKISGFYLTLTDQNLNLSIFARDNKSGPEIFRTNLVELTRLRQKRLN